MSRFGDAWAALTATAEARSQATDTLAFMLDQSGRGSRARNSRTTAPITQESAFKNSVWFAGMTLWADVVSSFPLDVYRPAGDGLLSPVSNPGPMFDSPSPDVDITEFLYSSTMDKRRYGNCVGIIQGRNSYGAATVVELQKMSDVAATMSGSKLVKWRIGRQEYDPVDIWHEKEYTLAGFDLGMSPLANAAATMGIYQSTQDFALDWFALGANPRGILKNTERDVIPAEVRDDAKLQFREATQGGDIFVAGREWEWVPQMQDQMSNNFLKQQAASDRDVCRFVGVPASMIDVEVSTGNITYANVTQANLQWLISRVGPFARRTERYWTRNATPRPWTVKLNTDALLRMDPQTRATLMIAQADAMLRVPSELRALDNLPDYTPEQLTELSFYAKLKKPPATPGPQAVKAREDGQPWQIPA